MCRPSQLRISRIFSSRPQRSLWPWPFVALVLATTIHAQQPLRIWGDTDMGAILTIWEAAYQQQHPEARFENHLLGTDTAIPALYGGAADIALLGREPNQTEHDGFLHSTQHQPLQLQIARGALDAPGHSYALAVFVSKENPVQHLTLAQLALAFGCNGSHPPARTWADLGLAGTWTHRPLHLYTFDMESGSGAFFLTRIQGPSRKMNWAAVREFRDIERPDGTLLSAGEQTMNALLADRYGLAVSGLRYAGSRDQSAPIKVVALAVIAQGPYVLPTRETIINATYPLTRLAYAFADRPPGKPLTPRVRDFLQYLLSPEAQQRLLSTQPNFLPLSSADAASEQSKLR